MSERLKLHQHGHGENDEDPQFADIPATKCFHHGDDEDESDTPTEQWQNNGIHEIDEAAIKPSKAQDTSSLFGMIDTYDRPASAKAEGGYAKQGTYASGYKNKPGHRTPKKGYLAEAGIGRARAEYSIFEAEAKGPNASVGAEVNLFKFGTVARAEIASASAKAGPLGVKVGLGLDTGASAGWDGVEVKFLGIGFSVGPKIGLSFLGSEVSLSLF